MRPVYVVTLKIKKSNRQSNHRSSSRSNWRRDARSMHYRHRNETYKWDLHMRPVFWYHFEKYRHSNDLIVKGQLRGRCYIYITETCERDIQMRPINQTYILTSFWKSYWQSNHLIVKGQLRGRCYIYITETCERDIQMRPIHETCILTFKKNW